MELTNLNKRKRYHFIGIGGSGMSGLAKALLKKGYFVSGSDLSETLNTIKLKDLGAKIFIGHHKKNVANAHIIVISTAINQKNPELIQAKEDHLLILHRSELLNQLLKNYPISIGITGTHGKTTSSAMLVQAIEHATNNTPSFIIGSELHAYASNALISNSPYMVFEADESDGSFTNFSPNYSIITNLEAEHLTHYGTQDSLLNTFTNYISDQIKKNNKIIYNKDCKQIEKVINKIKDKKNLIGFGLTHSNTLKTTNIMSHLKGINAKINDTKTSQDHDLSLPIFGQQNIENALAVLELLQAEKLSISAGIKGLNLFQGSKRRTQFIKKIKNIKIYDDYAHHPKEVYCTLKGIKESLNAPIVCIFQPHRYTRTRDHFNDFIKAFEYADQVIITQIYAANETPIKGVTGKQLCQKLKQHWPDKHVQFVKEKSLVASILPSIIKNNHIIITMGAGNIHTIGNEIINQLNKTYN